MAFKTNADIQNDEYGQWTYDAKSKSMVFIPLGKAVTIESITDDIETGAVTLLLSFDFLGVKKYLEVPHKILADPLFLHELCEAGADVTKKTFHIFVDTLRLQELEMEANGIPADKVYSKIGWKTCQTATGKKLCYRADTMIGDSGRYIGNLKVKPMGSFVAWKNLVEQDVLGHIPLEIALLAGLSAVVNGLISTVTTGENPLIHIMGISGSGKSTAGLLCASVSGEPFDGERRIYDQHGIPSSQISVYGSWAATENATIARCAGNRGCVVVLNEIGKFKGNDLSTLIYNLSEGTDRLRMTKELKTKLPEGYSTTIVSIGEHSLLGRCASKADGLRSRVLEIDQPMTSSAEQADRIKSVCRKNNGHAAPKLAEYIINNGGIKNVLTIYDECRKKLLEIWPDTPSRERFVSKFPALLLTTAILAEAALGISFSQQELIDFFLQHESNRGELRNSAASSYPFIVEHCHTYVNKFILKIDKTSPQYSLTASKIEMPKAECWGMITRQQKQHIDGRWIIEEFVVRKGILEKMLKDNGYENLQTCIDEWKKKGVLDFEDEHHPRRYRTIDGSKERAYVFRVFATEEEAAEIEESLRKKEQHRPKILSKKQSSQVVTLLSDDDEEEVVKDA